MEEIDGHFYYLKYPLDEADSRFDRAAGVVMTDLDRGDLHQMADERL